MGTLTRSTWTDDDGSGGFGSIENNAELQKIYDNVEAEVKSATNPTITTKAVIDNVVKLNGGSVPTTGPTMIVLDGVTSDPAVSPAGDAVLAFRSDLEEFRVSRNGGAYNPLQNALRQTFRGLTLRTHPDADKAASQVYLDHADEIVMHDGTRVTDWDDLAADITVSGANGLDTGPEGASRWYEIHVIRKSSDGTKGLLLHRAKNYLKDQSFETATDANYYLRAATATESDKLAQGVTFATAGPVPFVDVQLNKSNSPTGNMWLTIEADVAGSPSGTPLATSDKLDVSQVPSASAWVRFVFRSPVTVSAAAYHLVLQGDYTRSDTVYVAWRGVVAGGYAGGSSKRFNGAAWSATTGIGDLNFKAYVTANDAAVTMPSGYDQRCLVGYAYNGSGSDFRAFLQRDRDVRTGYTGMTVLNAATVTALTLLELEALVPPVPVLITQWEFSGSAAGNSVVLWPGFNHANLAAGLWTAPGASYANDCASLFPCELQHAYCASASATFTAYLLGWRF